MQALVCAWTRGGFFSTCSCFVLAVFFSLSCEMGKATRNTFNLLENEGEDMLWVLCSSSNLEGDFRLQLARFVCNCLAVLLQ